MLAVQLATSGRLSLDTLLRDECHVALARCPPPGVADGLPAEAAAAHGFAARVESLRALLASEVRLVELLRRGVLAVLEGHATADASGKQLQTRVASSGVLGGTFAESLHAALHLIFVQAYAHVLRTVDENFNVALLDNGDRELWFAMAASPAVLNWPLVAASAQLGLGGGRGAALGAPEPVPNGGRHGPLIARFPFSAKVVRALESAETKSAVDRGGAADAVDTLSAMSDGAFGDTAAAAWRAHAAASGGEHLAYLHDYVASTAPRFGGLPFATQLQLHTVLLRASHARALASPAGIHASSWHRSEVLFHASALIAAAALPTDAAARFFAAAAAAADLESLIAALLAEVLGGCDRRLRAAARAPADAAKEAWRAARHVRRVAADVEALLAQGGGAAAPVARSASSNSLSVNALCSPRRRAPSTPSRLTCSLTSPAPAPSALTIHS